MFRIDVLIPRRSTWLALAVAASTVSLPISGAYGAEQPIHQLRIYEIFDDNKTAFHDRFRDHAMRIMARHRFDIVAMWEARHAGRTEFVYLLEWPDEATMKAAWTGFLADQEWIDIKKESRQAHGAVVGEIEDRTLKLTGYSPRSKLAK